jgi:hypothetical protein
MTGSCYLTIAPKVITRWLSNEGGNLKIGFHSQGLSLRGTEIALYDYALHNQTILNNDSVIFHKLQNSQDSQVLKKFQKHFKVLGYETNSDLCKHAELEKIDLAYFIKSGDRDGSVLGEIPTAVHAVFPTKPSEFHGDKFAFVSEWLAKEYSNNKIPFVPHMITRSNIVGDLRDALSIPVRSTVLGCYGGSDSFNLAFVHKAILDALTIRKDIFFIFMNITPFAKHERLLFLPGSADLVQKEKFINTCDGMIHARGIGESFGLACGEFSIHNKPVITYSMSPQRSHIEILSDKCILYNGAADIRHILLNFDQSVQHERIWDAYSDRFGPTPVMSQFKNVFMGQKTGLKLSSYDLAMIQRYRFIRKIRNLRKKFYY